MSPMPLIPGFLSVCVVFLGAGAATPRPEFVSVNTSEYEIHASSPALLELARAQANVARAQFAATFGGAAPKVYVVAATSGAELSQFDVRALRTRVGMVTVYVPPSQQSNIRVSGVPGAALLGDLPFIVTPGEDSLGLQVRASLGGPAATGVDLRAEDMIVALAGSDAHSAPALLDAIARRASGTPIELTVRRAGSVVTVRFLKPAGSTLRSASSAPGAPGAEVLAHEIGHQLFSRFVTARLGGSDAESRLVRAHVGDPDTLVVYGSPLMPDWLDELGAVASESPDDQLKRRKHLATNFGARLPLARLFTAEHPALPGLRILNASRRGSGGRAPDTQGPVTLSTVRQAGGDAIDPAIFYAQSLSVGAFLLEREGLPFLLSMIDGLARGRSMQDLLQTGARVTRDLDALERAWTQWATM